MNTYVSGTLVTTAAAFTNNAGQAADPDTVTLKYQKTGFAPVTVLYPAPPVIRTGQGAYHADLDTSGFTGQGFELWTLEWIGTGAVQVPGIGFWQVQAQAI